jgi:hypothetical protein
MLSWIEHRIDCAIILIYTTDAILTVDNGVDAAAGHGEDKKTFLNEWINRGCRFSMKQYEQGVKHTLTQTECNLSIYPLSMVATYCKTPLQARSEKGELVKVVQCVIYMPIAYLSNHHQALMT